MAIDRLDAVVWGSRKLASSFNELGDAHALCCPTPYNNVFGAFGRLRRPPENTAREALKLGQQLGERERRRLRIVRVRAASPTSERYTRSHSLEDR